VVNVISILDLLHSCHAVDVTGVSTCVHHHLVLYMKQCLVVTIYCNSAFHGSLAKKVVEQPVEQYIFRDLRKGMKTAYAML
jgi:hypothetical protein